MGQCKCRVAIVEPVAGSTRLAVSAAGLKVLRGIEGPVAPIIVIGPYRSGKSFFINQMLNQSCGALPSALPTAWQTFAEGE
jgi:hypothetical protein